MLCCLSMRSLSATATRPNSKFGADRNLGASTDFKRAFTLVEVLVTIAIIAIFLASLYAVNSQVMLLIHSSRNQNAASRILQDRTEQMRAAGWNVVTSPDQLKTLFERPAQAESSGMFAEATNAFENITVTALETGTLAEKNANIILRRENGITRLSFSGNLAESDIVRLDLEVGWDEANHPAIPKRVSATISRGGLVTSSIARPGTRTVFVPNSPTPTPTPTPAPGELVPKFCKHGKPWPHCGIRPTDPEP